MLPTVQLAPKFVDPTLSVGVKDFNFPGENEQLDTLPSAAPFPKPKRTARFLAAFTKRLKSTF